MVFRGDNLLGFGTALGAKTDLMARFLILGVVDTVAFENSVLGVHDSLSGRESYFFASDAVRVLANPTAHLAPVFQGLSPFPSRVLTLLLTVGPVLSVFAER